MRRDGLFEGGTATRPAVRRLGDSAGGGTRSAFARGLISRFGVLDRACCLLGVEVDGKRPCGTGGILYCGG
jgi:hypothetical protein